MSSRDERLARNEALFREVNERISEVNALLDVDAPSDYLCECARRDCTESLSLPPGEYEAVRADPTHFIVRPGHEDPRVEHVVVEAAGYNIVEKTGEAADEAVALDPRS